MQEFITIPTSLISELPDDKKLALLDIFLMADENGEFYSTVRELSDRWKWGSKKTFYFLKNLEQGNVLETQRKHKGNTLYRINTAFLTFEGNTKETQRKHKGNTGIEQKTIKSQEAIEMITDAWNELSSYGIEQIPVFGMTNLQYFRLMETIKAHSVTSVIETIQKIKQSDFLQGKNGGWKITFDWFVRLENFEKVLSGNYDWKSTNTQNQSKEKQMIDNHREMVREWLTEQEARENE